MPKYVINGLFLTQQITGIQRYAYEICRELDRLAAGKHIKILTPRSFEPGIIRFQNMKITRYGKLEGILWEQIDLRDYLKRSGALCVNFCNVTPLFVPPGITAVHDLMFKMFPTYFTTIRNKISRYWHTFQAGYAIKHERQILCTSVFTQKVLEEEYPCARGKVTVTPAGWQHVLRYKEDKGWQEKYPFLKPGCFFFSMATRAKNKNGQWVYQAAKNNPKLEFAVAGKSYDPEASHQLANLHMLGYIPDEDACALMKNCKAFLFPSRYEGFGIPPLEALALGAEIIVSHTSALPEVFGRSAHYIDPDNARIDLEELLKEEVAPADEVLSKYSWEKSAGIIYKRMYGSKS